MENYYDILEVSQKASEEIIEKAYKVLVKKYHPDLQKPQDKKTAEEKLKKINEAYKILSNSEERAKYDERLKSENTIKVEIRQEEYIQQKINNEYKNKEKITKKNLGNFLKAIGIMAIIFMILWFLPPTNKLMVEFYNNNPILKGIVDIIIKIVTIIGSSIYDLFANPPQI